MKATCIVCAVEFESMGSMLEQLAPEDKREAIKRAVDAWHERNGGSRGYCSIECFIERITTPLELS